MKFKTLKEKCEYYRGLTDYKLLPGTYALVMLDGRSFSKVIKKRFKLPFDEQFIEIMNSTAAYVCSKVQGAKFAYIQSDEISILLTDFDTPETDSFFSNRLCKILSIIPSIATGYFNKRLFQLYPDEDIEPVQFDAKAWNVPTFNDVYAWFLYRQLDCIRNSKQQVAQQYFSHKQLEDKSADEQVQLLKDSKTVDWWHDFNDGEKFGRFVWKEVEIKTNEFSPKPFERHIWKSKYAWELSNKDYGKDRFYNIPGTPKIERVD